MTLEQFQADIRAGIPDVLPAPKPYDTTVNHAPKRKEILSREEKVLAIKNALRYFPEKHHATLAPEFAEELEKYGRIYMYRLRPDYEPCRDLKSPEAPLAHDPAVRSYVVERLDKRKLLPCRPGLVFTLRHLLRFLVIVLYHIFAQFKPHMDFSNLGQFTDTLQQIGGMTQCVLDTLGGVVAGPGECAEGGHIGKIPIAEFAQIVSFRTAINNLLGSGNGICGQSQRSSKVIG
jgi:hypothetical protein